MEKMLKKILMETLVTVRNGKDEIFGADLHGVLKEEQIDNIVEELCNHLKPEMSFKEYFDKMLDDKTNPLHQAIVNGKPLVYKELMEFYEKQFEWVFMSEIATRWVNDHENVMEKNDELKEKLKKANEKIKKLKGGK